MFDQTAFRRSLASAAVLGVASLSLAACGGDDTGGGNGGSGGDGIAFGVPQQQTGTSPYKTLAEQYQKETGTKVEVREYPGDSLPQAIRTQLQSGSAPDVFYTTGGSGNPQATIPYAEAGELAPITSKAAAAAVPENQHDAFYVKDDLFGLPVDLDTSGPVFNQGAADEAGITYPTTYDDMLSLCKDLAGKNKSWIALAGAMAPNTGQLGMILAAESVYQPEPDWNQQRAAGTVTFADSEGWQRSMDQVLEMNEAGCFQKGAEGAQFDAITNGLGQGTSYVALTPGGAAADLMNGIPGSTFTIQPFPGQTEKDTILVASANDALSINADADNPEGAQDFVDWMAQPKQALAFAEVSGGVPTSGLEDATLPDQYADVESFLEEGHYIPLANQTWTSGAVYDAMGKGIQGLLTGQAKPEDVLASMDEAWDAAAQ